MSETAAYRDRIARALDRIERQLGGSGAGSGSSTGGGDGARLKALTKSFDTTSIELQRHKRLVAQLADTNRALREAVQAGLAEPELVNQALAQEVEALRAARGAEIAEIGAILAELATAAGLGGGECRDA